MQRTIFKNDIFYWLLFAYLILLMSWNVYALILGQIFAVVPVCLQLVLLFLILKKHRLAKVGISIWSILLMLGPGLAITGKLLTALADENSPLQVPQLLESSLFLILGIGIFYFNRRTVSVSKSEVPKHIS